jgi:hypothetical protein
MLLLLPLLLPLLLLLPLVAPAAAAAAVVAIAAAAAAAAAAASAAGVKVPAAAHRECDGDEASRPPALGEPATMGGAVGAGWQPWCGALEAATY